MSALDEMVVHSKQCKKDWLRLRGCSCWSQGAIKELTSLRAENARLQKAVEEANNIFSRMHFIDDDMKFWCSDETQIKQWVSKYGGKE